MGMSMCLRERFALPAHLQLLSQAEGIGAGGDRERGYRMNLGYL
jgi:hypothetical protein